MEVFDANILTGTGFNTYAYMHRVGNYEDTHNFFLKVLVEERSCGLVLFFVAHRPDISHRVRDCSADRKTRSSPRWIGGRPGWSGRGGELLRRSLELPTVCG